MECKACGSWFATTADDKLCSACERAMRRLQIDIPYSRLREMVVEVKNQKFTSGQEVWVVEREGGKATEYSGCVCVAQINMAVIVSPYINGIGDIVDILSDQIEQTAEGGTGDLEVYPISDCYETKEEAASALKGEQNG